MFQHDAQHTGRSQYVAPSRLALKWRFQVRGLPGSPAIGADGTIYLPSGNSVVGADADRQGFLYAVNPDGTLRWRFEFPPTALCVIVPTNTTPAVAADGTIYVHTQSGRTADGSGHCTAGPSFLYAINPDGTQKWAYQINDGAGVLSGTDLSSPAIGADGTVYLTSRDTGLYAINPNGTLNWAVSPAATSIGSSPAIGADGTIYVNIFDLHAYTPDGDEKWVAETGNAAPNDNSPAVAADGTIYACGLNPDRCHAVSPSGTVIWSFPLEAVTTTPSLSGDGTVYLVSRTDGLYAVNPDGTQLWHTLVEDGFGKVSHSPVVGADGRVYARDDADLLDNGSSSGVVYALNPDGTESDAEPIPALFPRGPGTGELSPAVGSDGTLYVPQPRAGEEEYNPDDQYLAALVEGPDGGDFLDLAGRRSQRLGKAVKVKAGCDEPCTATATGKLIVNSKRRVFKLKKDKEGVAAGERETLKLKVPDKARRTAQRSLADDGKAKAKIKVEAVNAAGDSETAKRAVKLK